jgi:HEAT repeat protein
VTAPDDALERAAAAAALGAGPIDGTATAHLTEMVEHDPEPRVRAAALGALARGGAAEAGARPWIAAAADGDASVRRRAAETAPAFGAAVPVDRLLGLLGDHDTWVAEAAAFALGERPDATTATLGPLAAAAVEHVDPLVRESAVAALGALGDPDGLAAVLHGCTDKPAIRRRAVLALAAFTGDDVEAALDRALQDTDWQVRQNAEDLLRIDGEDR